MIAAALNLLNQAVAWLLDLVTGFFRWLRKRRTGEQKWRLACTVAGCLCLAASFVAWDRQQRVYVVIRQSEEAAAAFKATIAEKDTALAGYRQQEQAFADAARREAEQLEASRKQSAEALAEVARLQAQADRNSAAWWAGYSKRPDVCRAAQEAMDVACATVGDY